MIDRSLCLIDCEFGSYEDQGGSYVRTSSGGRGLRLERRPFDLGHVLLPDSLVRVLEGSVGEELLFLLLGNGGGGGVVQVDDEGVADHVLVRRLAHAHLVPVLRVPQLALSTKDHNLFLHNLILLLFLVSVGVETQLVLLSLFIHRVLPVVGCLLCTWPSVSFTSHEAVDHLVLGKGLGLVQVHFPAGGLGVRLEPSEPRFILIILQRGLRLLGKRTPLVLLVDQVVSRGDVVVPVRLNALYGVLPLEPKLLYDELEEGVAEGHLLN